jgi:putative SOS response-associated peptidase YedK
MCGRYSLTQNPVQFLEQLGAPPVEMEPRYNIAPAHECLVVACIAPSITPASEFFSWGLIPHWDANSKISPINARAESLTEKPYFRDCLHHRRCLVIADGFYEWQTRGGKKWPHRFTMKTGLPFAFAGLYDAGPGGHPAHSFAIITTTANECVRPIHTRMPVILRPEFYATWLNPEPEPAIGWPAVLQPHPAEAMTSMPVSVAVNSVSHQGPECLAPCTPTITKDPRQGMLFDL